MSESENKSGTDPSVDRMVMREVLFFRNGSVAAIDDNGNQITELQQRSVMELFGEWAAAMGYTVEGAVFKIDNGQGRLVGEVGNVMHQWDQLPA